MGLITCKECKNQVSNLAKTCPGCGAPVQNLQQKILGFIILAIIIVVIISSCQDPKQPAKVPDTPENRAKTFRTVKISKFAKELQQTMHDPATMQFIKVTSNENASTVCMEYRARNGFGAMRADQTLYLFGTPYQNEEAWNLSCLAQDRYDLTAIANNAISK